MQLIAEIVHQNMLLLREKEVQDVNQVNLTSIKITACQTGIFTSIESTRCVIFAKVSRLLYSTFQNKSTVLL